MKSFTLVVVGIGVCLRLAVFIMNTPGNAYDNHLETIFLHMQSADVFSRVDPWNCWTCYQPPLYYWIASAVAKTVSFFGSQEIVWKGVQAISFFASCATLILTAIAGRLLVLDRSKSVFFGLVLTILAVCPRSIYTASMVSNDATLEAFVALSLCGLVVMSSRRSEYLKGLMLFGVGVVCSGWTKQSGLLMIGPAVALLFLVLVKEDWTPRTVRRGVVPLVLTLVIFLAGADEVWRYSRTGSFMVSNQEYFQYTSDQPPGSVSRIDFTSLRVGDLFNTVFMGRTTLDSYWTEIFARCWFDYERRFFPIQGFSVFVGRANYLLGSLLTLLLGAACSWSLWRNRHDPLPWLLLLVALGFFLVPLVQVMRLPFYSSMKALFWMPGFSAAILLAAAGVEYWCDRRIFKLMALAVIVISMVVSVIHVGALVALNTEAVQQGLSGPVWNLPIVGR